MPPHADSFYTESLELSSPLLSHSKTFPTLLQREYLGKSRKDYSIEMPEYENGVIIVGAGPSGVATAACLTEQKVPCLLIEKSDSIGSLWKYKTYDRLHLHIPKQFCELPHYQFPQEYPTYPTREQFVVYLEDYVKHFKLRTEFSRKVNTAFYDAGMSCWRVQTQSTDTIGDQNAKEFRARWLVVASGENAEAVTPPMKGLRDFKGPVFHSSDYKSGAHYSGKKVLVVGCGNSGMEIALDLANFNAKPALVVRSPVHILPREIFGASTFAVAMGMMKRFPLWFTDLLLVSYTRVMLGDTTSYGFSRPTDGPMAIKVKLGKTPVLDVGTFAKIKNGDIKVLPAVDHLTSNGACFEDGRTENFDTVVLATGYRSNVPQWLKDDEDFFSEEGFPRIPSPGAWKSQRGLYAAGLGRKGILGATFDAKNIAQDIAKAFPEADGEWCARVFPCQPRYRN